MLADNDKRNRKIAIELTTFFIAQQKQHVCQNVGNDLYTFPYMLKDPAVLRSTERLLWIMDRLESTRDELKIKMHVLDELWRLTRMHITNIYKQYKINLNYHNYYEQS